MTFSSAYGFPPFSEVEDVGENLQDFYLGKCCNTGQVQKQWPSSAYLQIQFMHTHLPTYILFHSYFFHMVQSLLCQQYSKPRLNNFIFKVGQTDAMAMIGIPKNFRNSSDQILMLMGCYLRPLIGPRAILNSVKNHTQLSDCTMANAMGNNLSLFYR